MNVNPQMNISKAMRITKSSRLYERYQAVRLILEGFQMTEVAQMTNHDPHTIGNYVKSYKKDGIEVLQSKKQSGVLSTLSAPARRALENHGITTLGQLAMYSEKEILQLHGIGPASMPKLRASLEENGYSFKNV